MQPVVSNKNLLHKLPYGLWETTARFVCGLPGWHYPVVENL
jgi:hypothetical protein